MEDDILDVDIEELNAEELSKYKEKLEEYIEYLSGLKQTEEVEEKLAEAEDTLYFIEMI